MKSMAKRIKGEQDFIFTFDMELNGNPSDKNKYTTFMEQDVKTIYNLIKEDLFNIVKKLTVIVQNEGYNYNPSIVDCLENLRNLYLKDYFYNIDSLKRKLITRAISIDFLRDNFLNILIKLLENIKYDKEEMMKIKDGVKDYRMYSLILDILIWYTDISVEFSLNLIIFPGFIEFLLKRIELLNIQLNNNLSEDVRIL